RVVDSGIDNHHTKCHKPHTLHIRKRRRAASGQDRGYRDRALEARHRPGETHGALTPIKLKTVFGRAVIYRQVSATWTVVFSRALINRQVSAGRTVGFTRALIYRQVSATGTLEFGQSERRSRAFLSRAY